MSSRFARLAQDWEEGADELTFMDCAVDSDAMRMLAAAEGVKSLPAIRVYGGPQSESCVVPCGPRGTGPALSVAALREAVLSCTACKADDELAEGLDLHATPANDLVFAFLPVSIVYVLIDKLGAIQQGFLGEVTEAWAEVSEVAAEVGSAGL